MINRFLQWPLKRVAPMFPGLAAFKWPVMMGTVLLFIDARAANVSLTGSDATGSSSFTASGHWNNGIAPNASNNYFTTNFVLRSPADTGSYTFAGSTLSIDPYGFAGNVGGRLLLKGTGPATITVPNLILNGGLVDFANAADSATKTLAGSVLLNSGTTSYIGALTSETFLITAPISGGGSLQAGGANINAGADTSVVALSGTNTYSGATTVATGTLLINGPSTGTSVIVLTNAIFGGIGSIGALAVQNGGTFAPGIAAHGTLADNVGPLTVDGGSVSGAAAVFAKGAQLKFRLNVGFQSDGMRIVNAAANDVVFSNNVITVTDFSNGGLSSGTYTLFDASVAGAYVGLTLDGSNYITAGLTIGTGLTSYPTARLRLVNNDIVLQIPTNAPVAAPTFPLATTNSTGASLMVGSNGTYAVSFASPAWAFAGTLAQGLAARTINQGTDTIGAYSEIDFNYTNAVAHAAGIRLYNDSPVVLFLDTTLQAGPNDLAFPQWANYPATRSHLAYGAGPFGEFSFANFYSDSPWLYFNTNGDTFLISAATNYMVASTSVKSTGAISCGINSGVSQLPAGFQHRAILVAQNGINQILTTWGHALVALGGKTPPANDASTELNLLGYWTDNGAAYYYNTNPPLGIQNTLFAIRNEFAAKGPPLSYVQVDSWWYEKAPCDCWSSTSGTYLYQADPTLFPTGLSGFQQQLGVPLITHGRWIDSSSPYVGQYLMSANVITDPAYWIDRMAYLKNSGVITYEQDWLSANGIPAISLTNGGSAYLGNMQAAAAAKGINLQYCMPQGRDYLQSSLYGNVMSSRVSNDIFIPARWPEFIYDSRLAQAMGVWPWTDEFRSAETLNLLVSTLSAGPVGTGDALGTVNGTNLARTARSDGVLVKPDAPLVPTDSTYLNDALGLGAPFVSSTYTDNTNSRAVYIFTFAENANSLAGSFKPADLGVTNDAYVYDYFNGTGTLVSAGNTFSFTTAMPQATNGGSYYVVVPVGPSGMAFLGDTMKFVTRGKKRISFFSDNGFLRATIAFAASETNVTLSGYAPSTPHLFSLGGGAGNLNYNATTHLFTVNVVPGNSGTATLGVSLAAAPTIQVSPGNGGNFQIFWPAAAAGYTLQKTATLTPPVNWSNASEPVVSNNGQYTATIAVTNLTMFYRLVAP
ncbi:MAG TPA: hypothetical protein VG347_01815 [Verrucomicrobiae bacterium]|nr:hypothetical protein [Verrucomicrobiae bacterium]